MELGVEKFWSVRVALFHMTSTLQRLFLVFAVC